MIHDTYRMQFSENRGPAAVLIAVFALLVGYWASIGLRFLGAEIPAVRIVAGVVLLLFVPGAMLTRLLGLDTDSLGLFTVFAVGLSLAALTVLDLGLGLVLPLFGVAEPLSLFPLAVALTGLVGVLTGLVYLFDAPSVRFRVDVSARLPVFALLAVLPVVAVAAAVLMNRFEANAGMFLFVLAVEAVVLLSVTRFVTSDMYPLTVFVLSLSTLLHRNLVTDHVLGADIQFVYYISEAVLNTHQWSSGVGGSMQGLATVTTAPATVTMLTGIELTTTFKVIHVLLFALVPVGIYYLSTEVFGREVAFFGSLFFVFYHLTFYFTPGKQLISELFVVLLLLLWFRFGTARTGYKVAGALLAVGLVTSHYGTTYLLGFALFAAALFLLFAHRFVGEFDYRLSLSTPVLLVAFATAWYAFAAPELIVTLTSIPGSLLDQLTRLFSGTAVGTGASYAGAERSTVEQVSFYVYVVLTAFVGLGLAVRTLGDLRSLRRGEAPEHLEYTAIALPFFAFFGLSFFVIVNLWADRVYQMVLPVLAPFMVVGYLFLTDRLPALGGTVPVRTVVLAVLVGSLFALNSGFVAASVGTASDYTFNANAHDYAFDDAERAGGLWLKEHADVERTSSESPADAEGQTRVYVDSVTYQMFRSFAPSEHYDIETVKIKDQWNPHFDPERIDDGYVFVRHKGVTDGAGSGPVPVEYLSSENATQINETRDVVYTNGDVTIAKSGTSLNSTATNSTADDSTVNASTANASTANASTATDSTATVSAPNSAANAPLAAPNPFERGQRPHFGA